MKRVILGFLVCLAFAAGASAQTRFTPLYDDVPAENCGAIDSNNPCYLAVGSYTACVAKGTAGEMCTKSFVENGVFWCAWVANSASCQCDARYKRTSGICTYYK